MAAGIDEELLNSLNCDELVSSLCLTPEQRDDAEWMAAVAGSAVLPSPLPQPPHGAGGAASGGAGVLGGLPLQPAAEHEEPGQHHTHKPSKEELQTRVELLLRYYTLKRQLSASGSAAQPCAMQPGAAQPGVPLVPHPQQQAAATPAAADSALVPISDTPEHMLRSQPSVGSLCSLPPQLTLKRSQAALLVGPGAAAATGQEQPADASPDGSDGTLWSGEAQVCAAGCRAAATGCVPGAACAGCAAHAPAL